MLTADARRRLSGVLALVASTSNALDGERLAALAAVAGPRVPDCSSASARTTSPPPRWHGDDADEDVLLGWHDMLAELRHQGTVIDFRHDRHLGV